MPLDPKMIEEVEQLFTDRPDLLDTFLKDLGPTDRFGSPYVLRSTRAAVEKEAKASE